jgi:hypothetical protein
LAHDDIFAILKADHDRHRDLIVRLMKTSGRSEERDSLFEELTLELKAHAAAEEQSLYASTMRHPDLTDSTRHSVAEHHEIEESLNDLAATDMGSGAWLAKFKALADRYTHHIDEEEEEHFPEFAADLDDAEADRIRRIFQQRKPVEKEEAEITPERKGEGKE